MSARTPRKKRSWRGVTPPVKRGDLEFHRDQEQYREVAGFEGSWSSGYRRRKFEVT